MWNDKGIVPIVLVVGPSLGFCCCHKRCLAVDIHSVRYPCWTSGGAIICATACFLHRQLGLWYGTHA